MSGRREPTREDRAIDPATGWQISPVVAAAHCVKPTRMLTHSQAAKVTVLKEASPSFVVMRRLAMRFRGLGASTPTSSALGSMTRATPASMPYNSSREYWPPTSTPSGTPSPNHGAVARPKANNRLKTLKRAMFGRAGIELLRARMLPLQQIDLPGK